MELVAEPTCAVDAGRPDAAVVIRRTEDLVQNFFLAFASDSRWRHFRVGQFLIQSFFSLLLSGEAMFSKWNFEG